MNLVRGKIFCFAPCMPIFFRTGLSFLPNRLKAARDCHTSITRQPPGIGPAMCASTPLTGQSASLFLRPFNIILTLFSYLARAAAPRNSKRTPMQLYFRKRTCAVQLEMSAKGQKRTFPSVRTMPRFGSKAEIRLLILMSRLPVGCSLWLAALIICFLAAVPNEAIAF